MRVPVRLLRQFTPIRLPLPELARVLNSRVSEVESIHPAVSAGALDSVRFVTLLEPLEAKDAHTRWSTDAGKAIVVGDRFGVKAGERYAAVLAGGSLPGLGAVEARTVAGLASEGLLVSEAQLGVGKDAARPLRVAPNADGAAAEVLEADEAVLEFDLEPNRPDLFAIAGVARDVAAIWRLPYTDPPSLDVGGLPPLKRPSIELRTPKARRYEALLVEGVRVGPSPQWLQNAVRSLGMRPINNVVDAANLVMLELGQPLHTFDADTLETDRIVLRMAEPGESITTLDGVARPLTDECLLVCDGPAPIAIAGVMGDARSEVSASTTRVLVECAAFDMASVRRASRRLSLRTEASTRFEKGLPLNGVRPAMERLAWLLREVAGGQPVALGEAGEAPPPPVAIELDRANIRGRLGMPLADAEIDDLLRRRGYTVGAAHVEVPEGRPDLRIPQDLVEEVGRLHGYEHVVSEAPAMPLASPVENPVVTTARRVRRLFGAAGWDEVYLPVWVGDEEVERFGLDRAEIIALLNPLAENLKYFRTTAWPALAEAAVQNLKELDRFALYEVGKVYRRNAAGQVEERAHAAGVAVGESVLSVRDALVRLAELQGAESTVGRPEQHPHLHPGRAFTVGGWAVGGELHPRLVRALGLRVAPVFFAADIAAIAELRASAVKVVPPARFPSVDLDLNVEVGARVEVAQLLAAMPRLPTLREVRVADLYPLPSGARVTLAFRFGALDRSLTHDEAMQGLDAVRGAMRAEGWVPA